MQMTFHKKFYFSSSFTKEDKVIGHNFMLEVTTPLLNDEEASRLESKVQTSLIRRLDSQDLGLHVDFLKGVILTDENLLKAFWEVLSRELAPTPLLSLALEKDKNTRVSLSP